MVRVGFAVSARMERLNEHLRRFYQGKSCGRWGIAQITNDLKDTMDLRLPSQRDPEKQETSSWQRLRGYDQGRPGPRWAGRGKGCVIGHIALKWCVQNPDMSRTEERETLFLEF